MALLLNHLAHPCFDVAETQRLYAKVLGLELASVVDCGDELRWAYAVGGDRLLVFATSAGKAPPADDTWETRHLGLTVASEGERLNYRKRLEAAGVPLRIEDPGPEERIYFRDPNGLVVEIEAAYVTPPQADAEAVLTAWSRRRDGKP